MSVCHTQHCSLGTNTRANCEADPAHLPPKFRTYGSKSKSNAAPEYVSIVMAQCWTDNTAHFNTKLAAITEADCKNDDSSSDESPHLSTDNYQFANGDALSSRQTEYVAN
eukprot:gene47518-biopygen36378